MRQLKN